MADTEINQTIVPHPAVHDLHVRVTRLEHYDVERRTESAIMKTDLSYVKENVSAIRSGINRILWAIGLSVLASMTAFVLSGGLLVTQ